MKAAHRYVLVLVTAPDLKSARILVRLALKDRLAACGNIIPKIESHFWWQGKIEKSSEALILFKTMAASADALEKLIVANHPYDTPEVIAIPLGAGSDRYLKWITDSVSTPRSRASK